MPRIRSPQNFAGGLALVALAILAFWAGADLEFGRSSRMGPGYMPKVLAGLIGASGLIIMATSAFVDGPALTRWSGGRLLLVLGAIVLFAFAIRPLGLVATGIALVVVATLAAPDARWLETGIFAVALVAFTSFLFPVALGLPLPIWPSF
jgi:uncharacterized membrane protein SirB2